MRLSVVWPTLRPSMIVIFTRRMLKWLCLVFLLIPAHGMLWLTKEILITRLLYLFETKSLDATDYSNYILDELYTLLLLNLGYRQTVDFKHQLDALV